MKIARAQIGERRHYGIVRGEFFALIDDPFGARINGAVEFVDRMITNESIPLAEVRLLAPCRPSKIVCIGVNYADHAREMGKQAPAEPLIFLKAPSAVIGPGDAIVRPVISERVDYEAEIAVVIGRRCRRVAASDAASAIFGYTILNDVTARDLQIKDVQFSRGKSFDTFCPIGPWIETQLDPTDLAIETRVNGEVRQKGRTSDMIHKIPCLIEHISRVMTLLPGDVIATGTPAGVGPLVAGDTVAVRIDGIGELVNTVIDER